MSERDARGPLKRANPKTIQDKVLVGYQGWFTCAGDGKPIYPAHHGWLHWFSAPIPQGGRPNLDLWPDMSEYSPSELFPAPGLKMENGDQAFVFSSRNPNTVMRHFHWMALHGVDGAFLQRFAGQCDIERGNMGIRDQRDEIGVKVQNAAVAEGRVYAIMYDVSGVDPARIKKILEDDWVHLLNDQHLLDCPNYLRENGKAVVALWGFGFNNRSHTPELIRSIGAFFQSVTPGGVYLMAGTPGHWRTSTSDADRNPEFVKMWTEVFDAISPWTVGRYGNEEEAERWGKERVKADADYLRRIREETGKKVDYIPVVLPGGSGYNLSQGKWGRNGIKRNEGRFLWKQIHNARKAGVRTIYGAMWDEYDEGTVFMPVVSKASQLPVHPDYTFLALDVDGHDLPSDWYMRVAGFAAEGFHGERVLTETFPMKELQDYWSTRPHYEYSNIQGPNHERIEQAVGAHAAWKHAEQSNVIDEAPPPYTLEEVVRPMQSMTVADSRQGNSDASKVHLPSGAPPPLPARTPSLAAPSGTAVPPLRSPTIAGRPPPSINASTRPTSNPPEPHVPSPSTRPHPPPRGPSMAMPTAMPASSSPGAMSINEGYMHPSHPSPPFGFPFVGPEACGPAGQGFTMPTPSVSQHQPPSWPSSQSPYAGIQDGRSDLSEPRYSDSEYNVSMGSNFPHQYGSTSPPPQMPGQPGSAPPPGLPYGLSPQMPGQCGISPPPGPPPPGPLPPGFCPAPPMQSASGYSSRPSWSYGGSYGPSNQPHHYYSGSSGGGGGPGVAGKALDVVENIAGRDTRARLEKGVKTLTNKFNKLK